MVLKQIIEENIPENLNNNGGEKSLLQNGTLKVKKRCTNRFDKKLEEYFCAVKG